MAARILPVVRRETAAWPRRRLTDGSLHHPRRSDHQQAAGRRPLPRRGTHLQPARAGTKRGVAHVLVYQYAGGSQTGLPPGGEWRCLNVEELRDIRLEPGAWRTAPNVFNPQTCLDEVDVLADPLPPRAAARDRRGTAEAG
ncbi:MAG: hypothetical protein ACRDJC_26105 [Thermomicrobiales bacterium]